MINNLKSPKYILKDITGYIKHFRDKLENETDKDEIEKCEFCIDVINQYIDNSAKYLECVSGYDKKRTILKANSQDNKAFVEDFKEFDTKRSNLHSNRISTLHILDRVCKIENIPCIYGKFENYEASKSKLMAPKKDRSIDDAIKRREIGNFSLEFAAYCTAGLYMNVEEEFNNFTDEDIIPVDTEMGKILENLKNKYKLEEIVHEVAEL